MKSFKDFTEEKEKGVDGKACWKGYKRMGTKKKGGKTVDNCVPMEDVVSVQPMSGPTGSMFAMKKEGKEHSWKSEGHYTKDGKEWTGPQHAHNGQVMTGKKHTADSQNLYHYKELSAEIRKKVAKTIEEQKYTKTQLRATKQELRRPKTIAKNQKDQLPNTYGHSFVGSQTGAKPPKRLKGYDAKKVDARQGIERHLERKREKDYWDDDTDYTKGCPILEKLDATKNSIGDYVKDFSKSDAPQFKGRSSTKRRQMAVAAYLKSKRRDGERALGETIKYNSDMGAMDWGTPAGTDYMKDVTPGEKKKKSKAIKESGAAHETKAEYRKDNAEDAPELGDYAFSKQDIKELEYEADNLSYEDALSLGMFDDEIDDTEVNITEVLSVQGRLKRRFAARKNRQKLKVARGIALRRGSSPDRLKKRATRGARGMVYKRLLKGRDKSALPPAEKGRLEKLIGMYAPLVSRLAVRMLPAMRKMEINRMKSRKAGTKSSKKYKAARPTAKKQTSKKFKIKK